MIDLTSIGVNATKAKRFLSTTTEEQRVSALIAISSALKSNSDAIIEANKIDLANGKENGLAPSLLDRLMLDEKRIYAIADSIIDVTKLPCVLNRVLMEKTLENGLQLQKITVPLGVIAVIFEARPNVTADSAVLCLKSGNAVILRGGKEAIHSNTKMADVMQGALEKAGFPKECIQLITDTSRDSAKALMHLTDYVDVLIPRGGKGLIRAVCDEATVPVIETGAGTCHVYVDKSADIDMAVSIIFNAKTSRPSVCNACECMLIHKDIANAALPKIAAKLAEKNVEIRGDAAVCKICPNAVPANESDWGTEFLDYIIAAKVVESETEAIEHIFKYGTMHSECIVTEDATAAEMFMNTVDAAAVYVNASTRFTDGGEFGFGAEIGISTQKLHARGPLGLSELTSYKYKIYGKGQVR